SVSTVYDAPSRRSSRSSTSRRGSPVIAARTISSRCPAVAATCPRLCGGSADGTRISRSSDRAMQASEATIRWPTCGGSKVPPKMPMRMSRRGSAADFLGLRAVRKLLQETLLVDLGLLDVTHRPIALHHGAQGHGHEARLREVVQHLPE